MPDVVEALTPEEQAELASQKGAVVTPLREQEVPAVVEPVPAEGSADRPAADPPVDDRPRTVPHAALHEEREAHKQTKSEVAALREQYARLEERTNFILQGMQKPATEAPPAPAIPDLNTDPVGYLTGNIEALQKELAALKGQGTATQEQIRQAQHAQEVISRAVALEGEFKRQTPDYEAAFNHLVDLGNRELMLRGVTDPAQRAAIIRQEYFLLANNALGQQKNPGEVLYELAQLRGYRKPADDPATPPAAPNAAPDPAARLATIAAGQQQARTLGSARGSGPQELTADRLANMSDEEFAKVYRSREARAIMGARV